MTCGSTSRRVSWPLATRFRNVRCRHDIAEVRGSDTSLIQHQALSLRHNSRHSGVDMESMTAPKRFAAFSLVRSCLPHGTSISPRSRRHVMDLSKSLMDRISSGSGSLGDGSDCLGRCIEGQTLMGGHGGDSTFDPPTGDNHQGSILGTAGIAVVRTRQQDRTGSRDRLSDTRRCARSPPRPRTLRRPGQSRYASSSPIPRSMSFGTVPRARRSAWRNLASLLSP